MKNKAATKSLLALAAFLAIGAGAGVTALASAQTTGTTSSTATTAQVAGDRKMGPGVHGTVTAINGTTITVNDKGFGANAVEKTYTVDASGAKFLKGASGAAPATVTIADIAVGDEIGVRGTVSGTSVVATEVMDGLGMQGGFGHGGPGGPGRGHGVMGTVSAISGNTVTITNQDGTSYTVDASSAKVSKTVDINVSGIAVGDKIGVEGTVSGTTVTATHIMDGVPSAANAPPATATQ